MNEFILVVFYEIREVIIDEVPSGLKTGDVIELGAGTHTISLVNPKNYSPAEKEVKPYGTSKFQPQRIYFFKE